MTAHQTVLYDEAIQQLNIKPDGVYVDGTFGRGGHSCGILQQLNANGKLLAFDRDIDAISCEQAKQLALDARFNLYHQCFADLAKTVDQLGFREKIDGILLDLGVSSPQLDEAARGFSFLRDGELDMRMDVSQGLTASQYLQQVDEAELARVLFEYGEERFARRIARKIVEQRRVQAIETTMQLVKLIEDSLPVIDKHKHPATRTFQAIRIEINQELNQLKAGLQQAIDVLAPGGRLVVIAFHSLEDRIVKRFIRHETGKKFNPGRLPIPEQLIEQGCLKSLGKPIKATAAEIKHNPRARSAILRVAEKI